MVALLASNYWAGEIISSEAASNSSAILVPFTIGKWIFTGCIIASRSVVPRLLRTLTETNEIALLSALGLGS